jgi:hypothetical protein
MKKTLVVIAFIIIILLILLVGALFLFRSRTTGPKKAAATERLIGMPAAGLVINPFQGSVDLKNISLENPDGFSDRVFASLPELFVDLDTKSIKAPVKHFREIRLHLLNVALVRRKDGIYNFESILHKKKTQREAEEKAKEKKTSIRIDRLKLRIGHIIFLDYTVRGGKPLVIRFDVNMDETYTNVSDLEDLGKKVSKKFMDKITIGNIQNFEVKDLPDIARSALDAIPDETKDRIFGHGKDRNRVLKELGGRFSNKIKDIGKKQE